MKRALIFLLLPLLLLSGCWDYTELNMQHYVMGMSIDYVNNRYQVCIETVKITGEPESLSASRGVVIKTSGLSIFDAVRDAITAAGKKLYWGHARLLVMSEEVARNHLNSVIDVIDRAQDVYSNLTLSVAKDTTAQEILTSKTPRETIVSEHIMHVFENEKPSRRFVKTELWQLQRAFPYTLIPAIHLSDGYPVVEGCAVIHNNALVGFLNGSETQIYCLLNSGDSGGYLPRIKVNDNLAVTLEILRYQAIKLKDKTRLDVMVSLSSADGICDVLDAKLREDISLSAEKVLQSQIYSVAHKPFGNTLMNDNFEVHVALNSAGLIRHTG